MPVTLKDVAKRAGVSPSTVSLVMSGDERISRETREKVLACVEELGYRINNLARGLKTSKTFTVGFLAPDITNIFFMNVAKGVEDEFRRLGYSVIICNSNDSADEERERLRLLADRAVDGVVLIPASHRGEELAELIPSDLPVVLVDRLLEGYSTDTVLVDNVNGTYAAMEQLIRRGLTRIGFIGGDQHVTSAKERHEGYLRALRDYALPEAPELILFGDYRDQSGYDLTRQLMSLEKPPDAIFVANYFMHLGTIRYFLEQREAGGDGPAPLIASFDDLDYNRIIGVDSIRVRQPMAEIGSTAARLLHRRMQGDRERFPEVWRLKTELVAKR
ncbi:LacI family DNA-binding transcriptional regulator [Gorillibacterium sp. sgz500922]|uniref:LacI family DNA-binding transcriptional regulator n=1 Tax=Gorillibacterium sp. sgz500922 TaxID=3446694 RepID=UPI003F674223